MTLSLVGCPPAAPPIGEPIPLERSAAIVNSNLDHIDAGLKASGRVTVRFADSKGARRTQHVDGKLLVVPPDHLRCELSVFDVPQLTVGTNDETFWYDLRAGEELYRWGHLDAIPDGATLEDVAIRPDLLLEALGLSRIKLSERHDMAPVQRIVDEFQQLIYVREDAQGRRFIDRELWLDRHPPRLTRRVLVRDSIGRVVMLSELSDYAIVNDQGLQLPERVHVTWPLRDGMMDFRIRQWQTIPELTDRVPSFIPPHELGLPVSNARCIDDDWLSAPVID